MISDFVSIEWKLFDEVNDAPIQVKQPLFKDVCKEALIYCGVRDQRYPDARAINYPFDLPATGKVVEFADSPRGYDAHAYDELHHPAHRQNSKARHQHTIDRDSATVEAMNMRNSQRPLHLIHLNFKSYSEKFIVLKPMNCNNRDVYIFL